MAKTTKFGALIREANIQPRTIFDIGAFDCAETLSLAGAFPQADIYAFECVPKLLAFCDGAIRHNPKLHLMPIALGECTKLCTFHESVGNNAECGSLLEPNNEYFEPMPTREITVPVFAIQDVLWNLPIAPPEVIWMDVQGLEIQVLRGMGNHIAKLKMLWCEVTYKPYYTNQKCVDEYDRVLGLWGFEKIHEECGIAGWFGNACYKRKASVL